MSIVCNFYYTITENGKRKLILGAELRKLLLARYQVQRNMFRFQQQIDKIRQYQSTAGDAATAAANQRAELAEMKQHLDSLRQALLQSKSEIEGQIEQLRQTQQELADEQASLESLIQESQTMLSTLASLESANMENLEQIAAIVEQDARYIKEMAAVEREIGRLEAELRFVNSQAEFKPIALATLTAMTENGYELRESISEQGLMTWFEQVETGHQIAIRAAPPVKTAQDAETWELLAETFNMSGETCLMEIEDFETSMEALEAARLEIGPVRIYPKVEHSAQREKHGILPSLSQIAKAKRYRPRPKRKETQ